MGNTTKIWLIVGAVLIVVGLVLFTVVMSLNHWDFSKLSTVKYVTNIHPITQAISDISVKTDVADIIFVLSETEDCEVTCYEEENARHRVWVQDGCLTVQVVNEKKWYEHIGINFGTPKLTVALPQAVYRNLSIEGSTGDTKLPQEFSFERIDISASTGNVTCFASAAEEMKIRLTTGDVRAENLSAGALDFTVSTGHVTASNIRCDGGVSVKVSTGKVRLNDVACNTLTSTGSTGDLILKNVTVADVLSAVRSTGDVKFDGCDAAELCVKTDTGDVTGSLRTDKIFTAETGTGRIEVPKTVTGGKCEITTGTGNIKIAIAP